MNAKIAAPKLAASLFEQLGGKKGLQDWVNRFYDKVSKHDLLGSLFPPDLTETRERQYAYFVEFFGGESLYTERYGKPFLRYRHRKIRIGRAERDAWMALMMEALSETKCETKGGKKDDAKGGGKDDAKGGGKDDAKGGASISTELIQQVQKRLTPLADAMINHSPNKQDAYYFQ